MGQLFSLRVPPARPEPSIAGLFSAQDRRDDSEAWVSPPGPRLEEFMPA